MSLTVVLEFVCGMMFPVGGHRISPIRCHRSCSLWCCRCCSVLLVFGNVVLSGVQSPILFILECCSMVEVGLV